MVNTNIAQRIYGGWSIPAERVDGTDALAVLDTVRAAVERARNGNGPQAVEALSVRMHGMPRTTTRATCRPACARSSPSATTRSAARRAARTRRFRLRRVDGMRKAAEAEVAPGWRRPSRRRRRTRRRWSEASTRHRRSLDDRACLLRQETAEHQVDQDPRERAGSQSCARRRCR